MSRTEPEIVPKDSEIYRLGDFIFEMKANQLRSIDGTRVALRSQSTQVLARLLRQCGKVVSKDALAETVWQDTFVTDDSLVQCIADIRRAIGDTNHEIVQTVPKQGYLVVAKKGDAGRSGDDASGVPPASGRRGAGTAVALAAVLGLAAFGLGYLASRPAEPPQATGIAAPLPNGPRIVLIPFRNLGENPDDAFFTEGLTRDINAQLSRFSNLFVIAPEAGAAFRDNPDCSAIRERLNADYILTGTAQRYNDRVRVTTAFLDAKSCRQLTPPGPFDRDLSVDDVLDIQLDIASKVASQVGSGDAPLFNVAVQQKIRDRAPETLSAYECVLQSYWFYQTFAPPEHRRARACLERTVKEEPGYSLAWSRLAFIYMEARKYVIDPPPDWAERAGEAAKTALATDRDNPDGYYAQAALSRMKGEDIGVFLDFANKAVDLNPNDSWILADLGTWLAYSGRWEEGEIWITRARALNPNLHSGFNNVWHLHAFMRGDYPEAIRIMLAMGTLVHMNMASLAASYALNGDQAKAEEWVARLRERYPDFEKDPRAPFRARGMPQELIEKLMAGLVLAGYTVPAE